MNSRRVIMSLGALIIVIGLLVPACGGNGASSSEDSSTTTTLPPAAPILTMIPVPAGTFQRDSNPANTSTVSAFSMSETEITRAQWTAILGGNIRLADPSATNYSMGQNDPVQGVSWYQAVFFCNRLSLREGLTPVYSLNGRTNPSEWGRVPFSGDDTSWEGVTADLSADGYRLPTEMEWMWAAMGARDGETGYAKEFAGSTGDNSVYDYAWVDRNADNTSHPVGAKNANELGLYDMSGNVWEWCGDRWDGEAYPSGPLTDYSGTTSGELRIYRGGGWSKPATHSTVSRRWGYGETSQSGVTGFRVVRR
jgi:formylglycine-generating enzyme